MINFSDWEIIHEERAGVRTRQPMYYIFDKAEARYLLRVEIVSEERWNKSRAFIYDIRDVSPRDHGGVRVGTVSGDGPFDSAKVTAAVMDCLDKLMCEVCHKDWGPVCDRCMFEVGDRAFLAFKELERLADVESHGKEEESSGPRLPRGQLW